MPLQYLLPLALYFVLRCSCERATPPHALHVYIALLANPPVVHLFHEDKLQEGSILQSPSPEKYASDLTSIHDSLLEKTFGQSTYQKLYSYTHLLNGFAAVLTDEQADILTSLPEVMLVERDTGVTTQTTHTPSYLGLPCGAWKDEGGVANAGEGIVIGIVDTGIDPTHPSFSDKALKPYPNATKYRGSCELAVEFPKGSCNKKLVGAQYFAAAAIAQGVFNASVDFASPLDADGHGTHTASTAAGNNNVTVKVDGLSYGSASGMAPRAHIAAYKALYRGFGGFKADVVAAIEKAVQDKVDILSLSIGVNSPPAGVATFFNVFDMAMFSATRTGVFVAHSAGNSGPSPQSTFSFSPWVCSVAASVHDRTYVNSMILGNHATIRGIGLAPGTPGKRKYSLILAQDALRKKSSTNADANECQKASLFDKVAVQDKLLICTYGIDFAFGDFTIKKVAKTANKLSAVGVVIVLEKYLEGMFSIPMAPLKIPAILVSTTKDVEAILNYYNSTKSKARARIHGTKAKYSHEAPVVASFSSRGPDSANDHFKIADVLKPNILAPGKMIWAAWSPHALDSEYFQGQRFALISGTSMAAPHIAGIAALVKQKNPKLSPAAVQSALMTTAYIVDKHGKPLLAQHPSSNITLKLGPATPFDYGAGAVNATAALDPGLIFDAGVEDYVRFLCTIPGAAEIVKNTTGMACGEEISSSSSMLHTGMAMKSNKFASSSSSYTGKATASLLSSSPPPPSKGKTTDLNLPSITIANLTSMYRVVRKVKSIGQDTETYRVKVVEPEGVEVAIKPMEFNIAPQETQELTIFLTPSQAIKRPSFGHFRLVGSHGHIALVPISIASAIFAPMDAVM